MSLLDQSHTIRKSPSHDVQIQWQQDWPCRGSDGKDGVPNGNVKLTTNLIFRWQNDGTHLIKWCYHGCTRKPCLLLWYGVWIAPVARFWRRGTRIRSSHRISLKNIKILNNEFTLWPNVTRHITMPLRCWCPIRKDLCNIKKYGWTRDKERWRGWWSKLCTNHQACLLAHATDVSNMWQ